jgi:hypothetical protein
MNHNDLTSEIDNGIQSILDVMSETFDYNSAGVLHCKDDEGNDVHLLVAIIGQPGTKEFRLYPMAKLFDKGENPYDKYTPVSEVKGLRAVQQSTLKTFEEHTGEQLLDPNADPRYN